jgi:predicted CXXCH cytochrome family protein
MSDTGKQRRSRIELGYYRKPDAMSRWRGRLTLLVFLVAAVWVIAAPTWDGRRSSGLRFLQYDRLASKGPLARPHKAWESSCQACHIDFAPINGSRWSPTFTHDVVAANARCETCHSGATHHASQRNPDVTACAECHRDHRGSDASLLAMDDSVCTSCHQNLPDHRDRSAVAKVTADSVTRFDDNTAHHPAFTPPSDFTGPNPGRITFSHARHMTEGMKLADRSVPFTFADLDQPEADRVRYGWTPGHDRDAVQLRCEICHRLDGAEDDAGPGRTVGNWTIARSSGALMLPITYEHDCRACHSLRFEPDDPKRVARHGRQPRDLLDDLREYYTSQVLKEDPKPLQRLVPPRPMPNKPLTPEEQKAGSAVEARTLNAIRLFFSAKIPDDTTRRLGLPQGRGGCVECHKVFPADQPLGDLAAASNLTIKPVVVRALWYESARFDHGYHRAVDCAACHEGVRESKNQDRPLLPDVKKCVECHAPATIQVGSPKGGAGVSCAECHRYHNGDHPAQGTRARARFGTAKMTVEQFLRGGVAHGK